jgi:hypothetical protein
LLIACLVGNAAELAAVRPSYLCFGNALVGGPRGAQARFLGSNYDWGQDLYRLGAWADRHPEYGPLAVTYYGVTAPEDAGLRNRDLPPDFLDPGTAGEGGRAGDAGTARPSGTFYWAVSSNFLNGLPAWMTFEGRRPLLYELRSPWLRPGKAFARVGGTLFIFRVRADGDGRPAHPRSVPRRELAGCAVAHSCNTTTDVHNTN